MGEFMFPMKAHQYKPCDHRQELIWRLATGYDGGNASGYIDEK